MRVSKAVGLCWSDRAKALTVMIPSTLLRAVLPALTGTLTAQGLKKQMIFAARPLQARR